MRNLAILICSVLIFGCSSDDNDSKNNDTNTNNGTSNNSQKSNNASTTATNNGTTTGQSNTSTGEPDSDPITCKAGDMIGCFSNEFCNDDQACENVSKNDIPLSCCVTGERGTKEAGEICDNAKEGTDCVSALCISTNDSDTYYCSKNCSVDTDCPDFMYCPPIGYCSEGARN